MPGRRSRRVSGCESRNEALDPDRPFRDPLPGRSRAAPGSLGSHPKGVDVPFPDCHIQRKRGVAGNQCGAGAIRGWSASGADVISPSGNLAPRALTADGEWRWIHAQDTVRFQFQGQ